VKVASYVCQNNKIDKPYVKHRVSLLVKVASFAAEATSHCTHLATVLNVNSRKQAVSINIGSSSSSSHFTIQTKTLRFAALMKDKESLTTSKSSSSTMATATAAET